MQHSKLLLFAFGDMLKWYSAV